MDMSITHEQFELPDMHIDRNERRRAQKDSLEEILQSMGWLALADSKTNPIKGISTLPEIRHYEHLRSIHARPRLYAILTYDPLNIPRN